MIDVVRFMQRKERAKLRLHPRKAQYSVRPDEKAISNYNNLPRPKSPPKPFSELTVPEMSELIERAKKRT